MSVARTVEISAESPHGLEHAILDGLSQAGPGAESAWVKDIKVEIADGAIRAWRVHMLVTTPVQAAVAQEAHAQSNPTATAPVAEVGDGGGIIPPASS